MVINSSSEFEFLNIIIGYDTYTFTQHIREAGGFIRFSCIPTVNRFVNVHLQIVPADKMVCAEHHALEMSPKSFNGIGGYSVLGKLSLAMFNDAMQHTFLVKT